MREYLILAYNRTFKGFEYFTPPKIPTCYYLRFNTKKVMTTNTSSFG